MTGMAGNRDTAWLGWVLVLPVTASRGNQVPTILLNQLDNLTDLHCHPVAVFDQCSQDNYYGCRQEKYTTTQAKLQKILRLHMTTQHQFLGYGCRYTCWCTQSGTGYRFR